MKESEDNQIACNLDMAPGLHVPRYDQRFMHAPHSCYPQKNKHGGMKCEPAEVMSETMYAK